MMTNLPTVGVTLIIVPLLPDDSIWGSGLFLLLHLDLGELGHLKLVAFAGAWLSEEFSRAHWIFPVCAPQNAM